MIVRLKLTNNRRPKHSLWLNKRYIWNSKTKIVNRSTQQKYKWFYRQHKSLSTVVQLSRSCWTDRITCVRKLDNIVWSDASWDIWNSPPFCHPNERWEITLRPTTPPYLPPPPQAAKMSLKLFHVFITQTGNNHPEIGARHAGKMVISL